MISHQFLLIYFYSSLREVAPRQDGKFEMDEEMFKVHFEFSVQNEINYEEAKGVFEEVYGDFGAHCRKTQGNQNILIQRIKGIAVNCGYAFLMLTHRRQL